jgi:hypothetical protein
MDQWIIRRIGIGESTSIWHINWLPGDGPFHPVNHSLETQHLSLVSDLIDHTTCSWRTDILEEASVPMDKEVILSIPLCSRHQAIFWACHYEKSGRQSTSSRWYARRKTIHMQSFQRPLPTHNFIGKFISDLHMGMSAPKERREEVRADSETSMDPHQWDV